VAFRRIVRGANLPGHAVELSLAAICCSSDDTFLALSILGQEGASRAGVCSQTLASRDRTPASAVSALHGARHEFLPLPPSQARAWLQAQVVSLLPDRATLVVELVLGIISALNFLYVAGWTDCPIFPSSFARLTLGQTRALDHFLQASCNFLDVPAAPFVLAAERKELTQRRLGYGGDGVSVRRDLDAIKVIAAWPKVGEACVCPIIDFIDEHLKALVADPHQCLLPEAEWPAATPRSKVYADDANWFKICEAGAARDIICEVPEEDIFRNQLGEKVLNGAMGVDKWKDVLGVLEHHLRFISIFTPLNCYMHKINGDSGLLPQCCRLNLVVLADGEFVWDDGGDLQSCFNLFFLPKAWRGFCCFEKKVSRSIFGGPAHEQCYVAIRGVPMGWVNSVDLIQNFIRKFVFPLAKLIQAGRFEEIEGCLSPRPP
jgi:hypothetical protein